MATDPMNPALLEEMKEREFQLKRKKRAADEILFRERRFRGIFVTTVGIVIAGIAAVVFYNVFGKVLDRVGWRLPAAVAVALCVILGVVLGKRLLRTRLGRRLLAKNEIKLRRRYTGDLMAGQRWTQFYYNDEDISEYVPQILYFLESDRRFDSIDEALAFAKQTRRESPLLAARALKGFNDAAAATTLLVLSTVTEEGLPASRLMRYVRTAEPGVWYISTPPDGPKIRELDSGNVALVTLPTPSGGTINSNRLTLTRSGLPFAAVADLYRAQVPGYVDAMTEDEQQRELVYKLTLRSARIDTWLEHEQIEFGDPQAT